MTRNHHWLATAIVLLVLAFAIRLGLQQSVSAPAGAATPMPSTSIWSQQDTTWDGGRITIVSYNDPQLGIQKHIVNLDE